MDDSIPEGFYRPIPIVWFTGAFLLQIIGLFAVFIYFELKAPIFIVIGSTLWTGLIFHKTWQRGMKGASIWWRIVTIAMLLTNFLIVSVGGYYK